VASASASTREKIAIVKPAEALVSTSINCRGENVKNVMRPKTRPKKGSRNRQGNNKSDGREPVTQEYFSKRRAQREKGGVKERGKGGNTQVKDKKLQRAGRCRRTLLSEDAR